jgi:hypothetical protein
MSCSKGSALIPISLPESHGAYAKGIPIMVDADNKVGANIGCFGLCVGEPCTPVILGKWKICKNDMFINGDFALIKPSILICAKSGVITFVTDGQH